MNDEIKETLRNADNEATRAPYWLILDPKQNLRCDPHVMGFGIAGPFFCREDAEDYLKATRYNFSKRAVVYCLSGHYSQKYENFVREIEKSQRT